MLILYNLAAVK